MSSSLKFYVWVLSKVTFWEGVRQVTVVRIRSPLCQTLSPSVQWSSVLFSPWSGCSAFGILLKCHNCCPRGTTAQLSGTEATILREPQKFHNTNAFCKGLVKNVTNVMLGTAGPALTQGSDKDRPPLQCRDQLHSSKIVECHVMSKVYVQCVLRCKIFNRRLKEWMMTRNMIHLFLIRLLQSSFIISQHRHHWNHCCLEQGVFFFFMMTKRLIWLSLQAMARYHSLSFCLGMLMWFSVVKGFNWIHFFTFGFFLWRDIFLG